MTIHNVRLVAIAGILAGAMMGAGASYYAQLLAGSGYSPNDALMHGVMRPAASEHINARNTQDYAELRYNLQRRQIERLAERERNAAPEEEVVIPNGLLRCEGLTRTRYTHCVGEYMKDGTIYQLNQTGYE